MNCCSDSNPTYNKIFDAKLALKDFKRFKKKGPTRSTRKLIDAIVKSKNGDLKDKTLLDIGGGIGAIGLTLNEIESVNVTNVDVSLEYLKKAEEEVTLRGFKDRFEFINADFLLTSDNLSTADIVTLDKAICCYQDFQALVRTSVRKSKNVYGIVIPRNTWWVKSINGLGNFVRMLTGNNFRTFVHPVDRIKEIIIDSGFLNIYSETAREWHILVFVTEKTIDPKLS